jgi:hypothetical protein
VNGSDRTDAVLVEEVTGLVVRSPSASLLSRDEVPEMIRGWVFEFVKEALSYQSDDFVLGFAFLLVEPIRDVPRDIGEEAAPAVFLRDVWIVAPQADVEADVNLPLGDPGLHHLNGTLILKNARWDW